MLIHTVYHTYPVWRLDRYAKDGYEFVGDDPAPVAVIVPPGSTVTVETPAASAAPAASIGGSHNDQFN